MLSLLVCETKSVMGVGGSIGSAVIVKLHFGLEAHSTQFSMQLQN